MSTQKFAWKDRDTAAQDLLQVAYHAPSSVSSRALMLLRSIRSSNIMPELEALVFDESLGIWPRRYALRAITSVSSDVDMPQLAQYMEKAFRLRCDAFRKIPRHRTYNSDFSNDLLGSLKGFVAKHALNREWFFEMLNRVQEPAVVSEFLTTSLNYGLAEDFQQQLFDRLLTLIDQNPDILTLEIVQSLSYYNLDKSREFLNIRLKSILEMCLNSPRDTQWLMLADDWGELREELVKIKPEFAALIADYSQNLEKQRNERQLSKQQASQVARESPAYKLLLKLYEAAKNDDYSAYDVLRRIAKRGREDIRLRAVGTYFIGQLSPKYDSLKVLQFLVKYANDDWGDYSQHSPIRYEAGEALSHHPAAEVWESLIDAFFVNPSNELSSFMEDWITEMTDILSGEQRNDEGNTWDVENRPWFHALAEIDEEALVKYANP
ncbi:MAG: hypothetical protein H0X30_09255 [Anaerolineae bacterium]|nr:hypothetical protein [Anaerolineae bacterium]